MLLIQQVLGVNARSSEREITSAYRALVKVYHPDINKNDPQAEEKFREIQQAYEKLSQIKYRRNKKNYNYEVARKT